MKPALYILSGLSGSGKSTWARAKASASGSEYRICSADHYFIDPTTGEYNFNYRKLGEAHSQCFRLTSEALQQAVPMVFVDNTNLTAIDIAPYVAIGGAYGYDVRIVLISTTLTLEELAERNTHQVSLRTLQGQHRKQQAFCIPLYWNVSVEDGVV